MTPSTGRIPDNFIESVLDQTDIVALIQESIPLKKNGVNYSACCPFHQEKTPSFTVSATKQFYHCFGCKAHGNAIGFAMAHLSMPFVEAIEFLASRLGMMVPKDEKENTKVQIKLETTNVLGEVAAYYAKQLKENPQAKAAITYLKKRGFTGKIAKEYQVGFAPIGWDNLLRTFEKQPQAIKILVDTGLIITHPQGRLYDRFRERIMFPIRDRKGNVIGFGGRVVDKGMPKYLNSPESDIFHKGHCLYGLHEALKTKQKWQTAVVVEGYLDVMALAQYGITGAVATLGTAVTSHHVARLLQYVSEIIFCFDGDKAGQGAAWKALEQVLGQLNEKTQVKFAFIPEGEDPDSFIRLFGKEAFLALIRNATPLSSYFFAHLTHQVKPDSVDNCARLANMARPYIEQIPAGIFKEMMFEQLAKLASSSSYVVRGERGRRPYFDKRFKAGEKLPPPPQPLAPAFIASALLLRDPTLYHSLADKEASWPSLDVPGMPYLNRLMSDLEKNPNLTVNELRQSLSAEGLDLKYLRESEIKAAMTPSEGLKIELEGAVQRLLGAEQQFMTDKLLAKAKNGELTAEEKQQLKEILQSRESI